MTQPFRGAAVYARVSTDKQSQLSVADQIRKCRDDAPARKLVILEEHVYADEAMSGVGSDRPAFQRMMRAAISPARPFEAILVDDTSRLSRNTEEMLGILRRLNSAGIQLIAVSQGIDSNDDQADVLVTVHGMVDSLYVKELAKKTHRGLEGLVLRGLSAGGRCFGYATVSVGEGSSKRLIVNGAEAAIVRRVFEMSASGVSLKKIAWTLNAERIPPPRPRKGKQFSTWCPTGIREMLLRELYIGRVIWNRSRFVKRSGTNRRIRRARPQSEWKVSDRPELRIVSDELWLAVRQRFERVKATYPGHGKGGGFLTRSATSSYLFSGLLKCGVCGGNLVIVTGNKGRHRRYGCSQHYYRGTCPNAMTERQEWLEQRLVRELQDQVLKPEAIDFALEEFGRQLRGELGKLSGDLGKMRARKVELEAELRRYAEAVGAGGDMPAIIQAMKARQGELDSIVERLLSTNPDSIEARLTDIRRFVTNRISDLRELLSKDVLLARTELLKHIQAIRMVPRTEADDPHYEAAGEWSLVGTADGSGPGTRPSNWDGCGGWI